MSLLGVLASNLRIHNGHAVALLGVTWRSLAQSLPFWISHQARGLVWFFPLASTCAWNLYAFNPFNRRNPIYMISTAAHLKTRVKSYWSETCPAPSPLSLSVSQSLSLSVSQSLSLSVSDAAMQSGCAYAICKRGVEEKKGDGRSVEETRFPSTTMEDGRWKMEDGKKRRVNW